MTVYQFIQQNLSQATAMFQAPLSTGNSLVNKNRHGLCLRRAYNLVCVGGEVGGSSHTVTHVHNCELNSRRFWCGLEGGVSWVAGVKTEGSMARAEEGCRETYRSLS